METAISLDSGYWIMRDEGKNSHWQVKIKLFKKQDRKAHNFMHDMSDCFCLHTFLNISNHNR